MKKLAKSILKRIAVRMVMLAITFLCIKLGYAATPSTSIPAADIDIQVSGAPHDNRYFLCVTDVGCMSILAAQHGKQFPNVEPVKIDEIYVTDIDTMHVFDEHAPDSCKKEVGLNHTIKITGKINATANFVNIDHLSCSIH